MSEVNIEQLFDNSRLPGGFGLFLLFFYTPLGLLLVILRFFIAIHAFIVSCLLPKGSLLRSLVLRTFCAVLGLFVSHDGLVRRDKKARVLVANYRTSLDHLAVSLVLPCIVPCVWDLPQKLMWALGYTDLGVRQGRSVMIDNAAKYCREGQFPLLTFPEGAFTNGKVALLKFSSWPFSLKQSVQTVLISISRPPFAQISPSVLGGRWWSDILWTFFTLYTCYHIRLLPSESMTEDETEEEFTRRIEKLMAKDLGVKYSSYTSSDKVEHAKRRLLDSQLTQQNNQASNQNQHSGAHHEPSETDIMAQQVKDVLPDVPVHVIRNDLALTKDVDLTITNILEGKVQYASDSTPAPIKPNVTQSKKQTHSGNFGKNPKDRHLSFNERKKLLYETARRKYMEKHGITDK